MKMDSGPLPDLCLITQIKVVKIKTEPFSSPKMVL